MKKGDLKKFALEHLYMNDKQVSCCYVTRMRMKPKRDEWNLNGRSGYKKFSHTFN